MTDFMCRHVFKLVDGPAAGTLVYIHNCEDTGDHWHIGYYPIVWLDGTPVRQGEGEWGYTKVMKNGPFPEMQPLYIFPGACVSATTREPQGEYKFHVPMAPWLWDEVKAA